MQSLPPNPACRAAHALNARSCQGMRLREYHTQYNLHPNMPANQVLAPRPLEPHGREKLAPDPLGLGVTAGSLPGLLSENTNPKRKHVLFVLALIIYLFVIVYLLVSKDRCEVMPKNV